MTTTARRDLRSYTFALLTAFQAADTGRVAEVSKARPPHFNRPMPFGYVDILSETATHDVGIRLREFRPSIVFVNDPDLGVDEFDELVDEFADYLTANPHIVPGTVWDTWAVTDESEEVESRDGSIRIFPTVRFTLGNVMFREGRL